MEETKKEEEIIEERKKKFFGFFKKSQVWVILILIIAIILGIYIRSLPMTDHGGKPGLWDVTTNNWTLGPDLDPWLFMRNANNIIETGTYPKVDYMRNVPLGFDNTKETMLLPYMIDWTYHASKIFYTGVTPEFAGDLFPVIAFALTIISFFLFVREIFVRKEKESKTKANLIALVSTFFMIVIPVFLSRTVAGIPEKESSAFFFMFLAFYFFLKAWKSEKIVRGVIFGILAGIFTTLMGLVWGGVLYIFIPIAGATLIAFVLNKVHKKEFIIYSTWLISSIALLLIIPSRYKMINLLTSLSSGLIFLVFAILVVHFLIWKTRISKIKFFSETKIPKNLVSLIIGVILIIIVATILFGPGFMISKAKAIHQNVFHPVTGRWNTTVAENRQPDFKEWGSSFGPFVKGIPLMFCLFIIGSVVLFIETVKGLNKKEKLVLTCLYILLILAMVFTRYSSSSIFNGENFISKAVYYGCVAIFFIALIYYYIKDDKAEKRFGSIEYQYILLFTLFLLSIFSARGAVRLIMVLGPIASIFVGYLIVESIYEFLHSKESRKIVLGIVMIIVLIVGLFTFWTFYKEIRYNAYGMIPSPYNQQWQKAMAWTKNNTQTDAVFGHWWDYGYWVQSIGERATVTDGGNAITFWNYWMGRLVLTGDNQKDALEFLYAHNTTHYLIDSSDIAKYGAFSQIGSDADFDRLSYVGTFLMDEGQTKETSNGTLYVYTGGIPLDEDLFITENGKEVFLPSGKTGVMGVVLPFEVVKNETRLMQPYAVMIYQGVQHNVNLRYASIGEDFSDFKSGINATAFVFPRLIQNNQGGVSINNLGAMMFLSPRLMRGMLVQKYILDDPFNNFPAFKTVHVEPSFITEALRAQGMNAPEILYYQGVQGPIKIWEINYPKGFTINESTRQMYLDKDPDKYLDWQL